MPLQISDLKCCRLSKSEKKNCPNKLRILPLSSIKLAVVDGTIDTDTHQHQLSRTCIVWALYIYLWKLCWKTVFVDLCRQRNTLFQGCQNFINLSKAQRSDKITPEKGTYSNSLLFIHLIFLCIIKKNYWLKSKLKTVKYCFMEPLRRL